jgi:hypothetical protein
MSASMIIEMVYSSTFWLNSFPPADKVSKTISPWTIIAGMQLDSTEHFKLEFGTYVQIHEEHNGSMATRSTSVIALQPIGNEQGGYYFLSLRTGRGLNENRWTALPMPAGVLNWIHTLARRSSATRGLTFTDRLGVPFMDPGDEGSEDESYSPDDDHDDDDDDGESNDGDCNEANIPNQEVDIPIEGVDSDDEEANEDNVNAELDVSINEDANEPMEAVINEDDGDKADTSIHQAEANDANDENVEDANDPREVTNAMKEKYGERSGAHN